MAKQNVPISYQKMFDNTLASVISPKNILAKIITNKLLELGVTFTKKEFKELVGQLSNIEEAHAISITISDEQIKRSGLSGKELERKTKAILANLLPDVEMYGDKLITSMPDLVHSIMHSSSSLLYKRLKKTRKLALSDRLINQSDFETGLVYHWGKGFDALETLIGVVMECGELWGRNSAKRVGFKINYKTEVLIALHARCCQITGEILALIKTGFADGAYARWRSLHEVTVIGLFICDHSEELARRYHFHQDIETFDQAEGSLARFPELKNDEEFQARFLELTESKSKLIKKFGNEFSGDYGWAAKALNNKRPTFRDIEASVDMAFLRPYYRFASMNVHASAKGAFYRVGLIEGDSSSPMLLAGRSDVGFEEPANLASISLTQFTIAILAIKPDMDQLVYMKVVEYLQKETKKKFDKCAIRLSKFIDEYKEG